MGFRKDEIRVEADVTEEEMAEFVPLDCPACGHTDLLHPEMTGEEREPFWCAECAHVHGTWGEVRQRIFTGGAMLAEVLARKL